MLNFADQMGSGAVIVVWSFLLVGALVSPHKKLPAKILTPKGAGIFVLASLTDRIHQVDLRSLHGPCFVLFKRV